MQASAAAAAAAAEEGGDQATTPSELEMPIISRGLGSSFLRAGTEILASGLSSLVKANLDLCWEMKLGGACTCPRVHSTIELVHEVFSAGNLISCCFA